MAPVVGITTSLSEAGDSQSVPVAYANAVADAGGTPLLLPMLKDPSSPAFERICGTFDALVIVGGGVIAKGMVGAQPDDLSDTPSLRDRTDAAYIEHAISARKPVLGICYVRAAHRCPRLGAWPPQRVSVCGCRVCSSSTRTWAARSPRTGRWAHPTPLRSPPPGQRLTSVPS